MKKMSMLLVLACLLLTGCSTTELEERSFPMLVAIELEDGKVVYKDAFPKEDEMGKHGAKKKDYNHLKVLVLEAEVLERQEIYNRILKEIGSEEKFPRNTYVCAMEDVEDLFEMEKVLSQDLGTYMEEYLKLQEEKNGRLLTLGDLLDEQVNHIFLLQLPYFEVENNVIIWKGYLNTSAKKWKESD